MPLPPAISDANVTIVDMPASTYYGYCSIAAVRFELPKISEYPDLATVNATSSSIIATYITYAAQEMQDALALYYVMPYVGTDAGVIDVDVAQRQFHPSIGAHIRHHVVERERVLHLLGGIGDVGGDDAATGRVHRCEVRVFADLGQLEAHSRYAAVPVIGARRHVYDRDVGVRDRWWQWHRFLRPSLALRRQCYSATGSLLLLLPSALFLLPLVVGAAAACATASCAWRASRCACSASDESASAGVRRKPSRTMRATSSSVSLPSGR